MRNVTYCNQLIEAIKEAPGMPEGERRFSLAFLGFVFRIMDRLIAKGMEGEAAFRQALDLIYEARNKQRKSILRLRLPKALSTRDGKSR